MVGSTEPARLSAARLRSARRLLQRKYRVADGLFLAEGRQAVREALGLFGSRRVPSALTVIVADDALAAHADLVDVAAATGVEVVTASAAEVASFSDTVTPQGIIAVCESVAVSVDKIVAGDPKLVVICAQVRDPGNAGTVIRCADAFGADAVIMTTDSVDLGNSKLVRASVGSVFHIPIVTGVSLGEAVEACHAVGMRVCAADGGGRMLHDVDLTQPIAWLMGNEAWGLPAHDKALADDVVGVPMWGSAESLNLSTAAAVLLYTTAAAQRHGS